MIRLSMLGQIELRDAGGSEVSEVLRQPKRLGLLAYLAGGQPGAVVRRDRLLSLFWHDLPEVGARNALRQALHKVRAAIGPQVIVARGADGVRVDEAELECDVWRFRSALRAGALSDALELYHGPLLPDFFVPEAPAFNEWVDAQRADLQRSASRAAWALAEQHERAGRALDAGVAARRAIDLLEDDEPALRQLLVLLERLNDSAGAVRAYEAYEERIRERLDTEPSPDSKALMQRIRLGDRATPGGVLPPPPASESASRTRIVIQGFENLSGDVKHGFVAKLIEAACRHALQDLRLIDVASSDTGVPGLVLRGDYHLVDERWQVRAFVQTVADSRGIGTAACVEAPRERPWEAATHAAERVAAVVAAHVDPRVASWAGAVHEPPSVEAHELHLRGMEAHLRGDFRSAIASFVRAASLLDHFSIPLLWAIQGCLNLEDYEQAAALQEAMAGHRERLSRAEQLGCDYHGALLAGDRATAFRSLQKVAELLPDSEVLVQLGREALFINRPLLAVATLERLTSTRGWIPEWTPYWRRLTEALHMTGNHGAELESAEQGRTQHPESVGMLLCVARAHAARGHVNAVHAAVESAVAMDRDRFTSSAEVAHAAGSELLAHGHTTEGHLLLLRAVALQRCTSEKADCGRRDRVRLAQMLYDASEYSQSLAALQACGDEDAIDVAGLEGRIHARTGRLDAAATAAATLEGTRRRYLFGRHLLEAARIAAIMRDAGRTVALLRMAFARGLPYGVELHTDVDLGLISDDPRLKELLRPKG